MVDLSFYSGKNVLVTGGAGFIGSSLVEKLHENEANISVLDDFSHGSFENLPSNNIEIIEGSVCHFESVLIAVKGIDIVFSLASKPFIPHSYVRPRDSIEVNVNGMFNVLEACAKENISRIVHLSSSEVYGTAQYTPMDEKHPLQPHSVYSISKLFSDRLCYIYHKEKKLPVTILRPFNAYGPRETHRYIIPETIHQFHNSTVGRFGNLESERDFTYVDDLVEAALLSGSNKDSIGETINIGTKEKIKMHDLVIMLSRLIGLKNVEIEFDEKRVRPFDVDVLVSDNKKAADLLGWKPKTKLENGLKRSIEWFRENDNKWPWEKSCSFVSKS